MKDKTELVMLLDFYGNLLKDAPKKVMTDYAERDLTISEIAENSGVSRQAVLDNLKKQEEKLAMYEEKLQLVARFSKIKVMLGDMAKTADDKTKAKINQIIDIL